MEFGPSLFICHSLVIYPFYVVADPLFIVDGKLAPRKLKVLQQFYSFPKKNYYDII